jgi:hypothetical protein
VLAIFASGKGRFPSESGKEAGNESGKQKMQSAAVTTSGFLGLPFALQDPSDPM